MHQPIYHPVDDFSWETFLKTGSVLAEDIAQLATEVQINTFESLSIRAPNDCNSFHVDRLSLSLILSGVPL